MSTKSIEKGANLREKEAREVTSAREPLWLSQFMTREGDLAQDRHLYSERYVSISRKNEKKCRIIVEDDEE